MKRFRKIVSPVGIILLLISCNNEKDARYPVIEILAPAENATFRPMDTITVKASISDNENLENVEIALVNEDEIPVLPVKYLFPFQPTITLNYPYILDDNKLESGGYSVMISAFDGINTKFQYQTIRIRGLTLDVSGFIIITRTGSLETELHIFDSLLSPVKTIQIDSGYNLSGVNSGWGQFCFATPSPSKLVTFHLGDFKEEWTIHAYPPYSLFESMFIADLIYVSSRNGDIWGYDRQGGVKFYTGVELGRTSSKIFASQKYVYAYLVSLSGAEKYLATWHRATGMPQSRLSVAEEIVRFLPDGQDVAVFANSVEGGYIYRFEPDENILTRLHALENKVILDAVRVDDQNFLISTITGIYLYNSYYDLLSLYRSGRFDRIIYEPVHNNLILEAGNKVEFIGYSSGTTLDELTFSNPVLDVHVIYNK
jgi:hypothetical protein